MKLALCLEYPIGQHGGTEVLVAELIRGLSGRHQILLVSPDDAASLARSPVADSVSEHISWATEPASVARARQLAQRLAAARPDLVHFHFGGNYAWKTRAFWKSPVVHVRRTNLPVLATNHYTYSIFQDWEHRPFLLQLALLPAAWFGKQFVVAHLHTEVAVSRQNLSLLQKYYPFVRSKFRCLYHSRLPASPAPPRVRDRENIILCTGTIGRRKGQKFLVEAFSQLAGKFPRWKLVLIGRDSEDETLGDIQKLVARHQIADRFQLLGPRDFPEIRDWLQRAAIFCIPSLHEGLGLSLQEAQYFGCACVGTRCGGVEDLIQDGDNGLLVPAAAVEPLAAALEQLMTDAALREKFSQRGPASVLEKGMTAEKMVADYEKLYAKILGRRA